MNKIGLGAVLFCFPMFAGLTRIDDGGLCGYADSSGKVVVAPQYRNCDEFSEGMAFVELDAENTGVIDTSGKLLFRGAYYDHGSFHNGLAPVNMPAQFECVSDGNGPDKEIHSDEERKQCPPGRLGASEALGGNWSYIDGAGRIAIPTKFREASDFHEGLARVNGRAFIDPSGQEVIPATSDFAPASDFSEGIAVVSRFTNEDGIKFGYIDKHGAYLVAPVYDNAEKASDGRALVETGGKFGYIESSNGSLTIAPQYDEALSFSEGLAAVRQGSMWGYIDVAGELAIAFQFDSAGPFHDGTATVSSGLGLAIIDKKGTPVDSKGPSLAQTFRRLQQFRYPYLPDAGGAEAPAGLLPIMTVYKQQLRDLAAETLKRFTAPEIDAKAIEAAIEKELERIGIRGPEAPVETRPYGLVSVDALQPPEQPELLAVMFDLNLPAQTDGLISLFHHSRQGWELLYTADCKDCSESGREIREFEPPVFTPGDEHGSFLMLLFSHDGFGPTWGNRITTELFQFDAAFHGERIFQKDDGAKEWHYELDRDGFRLETHNYSSVEGVCCDAYPFHYQVKDGEVRRIHPAAFQPRNFVGVWANMPWEEAAQFSDARHLPELRAWHGKMQWHVGDPDSKPNISSFGPLGGWSLGPAEACDASGRTWQVELSSAQEESVFFVVEQKGEWTFVMERAGFEGLDDCKEVEDPHWKSSMFTESEWHPYGR
jgi:hypothetical protein